MGYRLYVQDTKSNKLLCYGKLYGYEYEHKDVDLYSFRFLACIGKLDVIEDEFSFNSSGRMDIELTAYEYRLFIDLYLMDIVSFENIINYKTPEYMDIYRSENSKMLRWF